MLYLEQASLKYNCGSLIQLNQQAKYTIYNRISLSATSLLQIRRLEGARKAATDSFEANDGRISISHTVAGRTIK